MAFSQASITDGPTQARSGRDLLVSWSSSAPAGTTYQLYKDRRLVWTGTTTRATLPYPGGPCRFDVGTVGVGEDRTDFSGALAAAPPVRARVEWDAAASQSPDLAGHRVYMGRAPGGAVDFSSPVATIPYAAPGHYTWTSGRLAPGVWSFAVSAYDTAGNEQGSPATATATIAGPPLPPAADADGKRLTYTLATGRIPTLHWLASPS